jgi:mannose-6-phosphate isomerase-like protein (cupin superfamily)
MSTTLRSWRRAADVRATCVTIQRQLAAADRAGEVDHQRDGGPIVKLLPSGQGLPGPEVDGEAEHGAQQRAPRPPPRQAASSTSRASRRYREDELSYVLSGEIGVRIGDRDYVAGPGSYVFKPRGIPHTFWNAGPEPAHLLEIIWPAGFGRFFAELGELAETCPPEEFPERRAELAREYDHHFVHPEWVPELQSKHGLKMLGED